jgi:hypothetical protein
VRKGALILSVHPTTLPSGIGNGMQEWVASPMFSAAGWLREPKVITWGLGYEELRLVELLLLVEKVKCFKISTKEFVSFENLNSLSKFLV